MTVRKCKNFDETTFLADLSKIQFDEIKNITDDPNEMWTIWKTWFLDVLIGMLLCLILQLRVTIYPISTQWKYDK